MGEPPTPYYFQIMKKRNTLLALAALVACPAWAHSPYRQWAIFRQRFLLITTTRDDKGSDDLGEEIARILLELLPTSHAQVSRARDWSVLASLVTTRQTELAVLSKDRSVALFHGEAPYQDFGPAPLRVVVETDRYRMVCREDFPKHHAFLLCEALMQEKQALGFSIPADASPDRIPTHPGALSFLRGEPLPAVPQDEKEIRRVQ